MVVIFVILYAIYRCSKNGGSNEKSKKPANRSEERAQQNTLLFEPDEMEPFEPVCQQMQRRTVRIRNTTSVDFLWGLKVTDNDIHLQFISTDVSETHCQ